MDFRSYETPWSARCPVDIFFFFKIPFSGTQHDFKGFLLVIISVSFYDLGVELNTQYLVKFFRRHLFQEISKWRDWHQLRKTFVHSLFCGAGRILTLFIHSDRVESLCCFHLKLPKPGNIYLLEMVLNLLSCGFVCLCFAGLGIMRIWSRC